MARQHVEKTLQCNRSAVLSFVPIRVAYAVAAPPLRTQAVRAMEAEAILFVGGCLRCHGTWPGSLCRAWFIKQRLFSGRTIGKKGHASAPGFLSAKQKIGGPFGKKVAGGPFGKKEARGYQKRAFEPFETVLFLFLFFSSPTSCGVLTATCLVRSPAFAARCPKPYL